MQYKDMRIIISAMALVWGHIYARTSTSVYILYFEGMNRSQFEKFTYGMDENSPEYIAAEKKMLAWEKFDQKQYAKRQAMNKKFELLAKDVRQALQVSKIKTLSETQIIETGKALKALHDVMKKNGLIHNEDRISNKWT
jgi:hypothetical protein